MAIIIEVKVVPSSGRLLCKQEGEGRIKCYLKSPAEKNKANNELIELFAKALKIPRSSCTIISGATDRVKRIRLATTLSYEEILSSLGIDRQMQLW